MSLRLSSWNYFSTRMAFGWNIAIFTTPETLACSLGTSTSPGPPCSAMMLSLWMSYGQANGQINNFPGGKFSKHCTLLKRLRNSFFDNPDSVRPLHRINIDGSAW